jgi:hypothetical protein
MLRFVLACLLAAIAMFLWGMLFWTTPLPYSCLQQTKDDAAAGESLSAHFPESGTYILPGHYNSAEKMNALYQTGPIAMIHLRWQGSDVMPVGMFVRGFLVQLVTVIFIALLLKMALPALASYGKRVLLVALAGLAAAFFTSASNLVWWHHPWAFYVSTALYEFSAWVAVGLVLAALLKPQPKPAG